MAKRAVRSVRERDMNKTKTQRLDGRLKIKLATSRETTHIDSNQNSNTSRLTGECIVSLYDEM